MKAKQLTSSYLVVPGARPLIDWVNCALMDVEENIKEKMEHPFPAGEWVFFVLARRKYNLFEPYVQNRLIFEHSE